VCLLLFVIALAFCQTAPKPNILMILADDFGWANVGYHRNPPTNDVQTPNIDELVKEGIELDRHYVYMFCSPTRSSLQSGRNPIHVNLFNLEPTVSNPADPVSGFAAVPRNMTGIATKLKQAGYATHMFGKWDAGMATPDHTPQGRGYDTSLNYFHHANDYWTERNGACSGTPIVDLWNTDHPAVNLTDPASCSQQAQAGCVYEDQLFQTHVISTINNHDVSTPLFIYWAPHIVHEPLEVPDEFLVKFNFIDVRARHFYQAMVNYMDTAIGNVIAALKSKGLYDNTLIVFSSDNGGPIYNNGTAGANNYPLRGGKASNWEGGVRVNAFASGGFIPPKARGTKRVDLIGVWDWYATFSALAGVDPTDTRAALAKLPPIDSLNMWPYLSGDVASSPRTEVALGDPNGNGINGLILGDYKILLGPNHQAGWTGPVYPNITTNWISADTVAHCGPNYGCLFNLKEDPTEHNDIADQNPDILTKLRNRLLEIRATVFDPDRGAVDPRACQTARTKYNGYWGPWID